jgi:localization factor PodJL
MMAQPVPWNVRGIDPDVREAALLAARRSGMTLGQWLNAVIGDTVSSEGVPQAVAGESAAAADPFAAVTRRIRAFNDRGSSAAMAAAGAAAGKTNTEQNAKGLSKYADGADLSK